MWNYFRIPRYSDGHDFAFDGECSLPPLIAPPLQRQHRATERPYADPFFAMETNALCRYPTDALVDAVSEDWRPVHIQIPDAHRSEWTSVGWFINSSNCSVREFIGRFQDESLERVLVNGIDIHVRRKKWFFVFVTITRWLCYLSRIRRRRATKHFRILARSMFPMRANNGRALQVTLRYL